MATATTTATQALLDLIQLPQIAPFCTLKEGIGYISCTCCTNSFVLKSLSVTDHLLMTVLRILSEQPPATKSDAHAIFEPENLQPVSAQDSMLEPEIHE
jgi:hypothetical protein